MWGQRKCCPGRQVLQVEVPSGTSWETPSMQLDQIRKEEIWECLSVIGQRRIREPREIKWEDLLCVWLTLFLLSFGCFPPHGRFQPP